MRFILEKKKSSCVSFCLPGNITFLPSLVFCWFFFFAKVTLIIKLRTIYVLYPEESRTAQVKLIFYTEISQSYWLDCAFHWVSKGWRVPSSSLPLPAAHNRSFNLPPHHQLTVSPSGVLNEEAEQDNRPAPGVGGAGRSLRRGEKRHRRLQGGRRSRVRSVRWATAGL